MYPGCTHFLLDSPRGAHWRSRRDDPQIPLLSDAGDIPAAFGYSIEKIAGQREIAPPRPAQRPRKMRVKVGTRGDAPWTGPSTLQLSLRIQTPLPVKPTSLALATKSP